MIIDRDNLPDDADETIVGFLEKHDQDSRFWLTRTPEERLEASQYLTWMHYGREACSQPMRKDVFRITDLESQDEDRPTTSRN